MTLFFPSFRNYGEVSYSENAPKLTVTYTSVLIDMAHFIQGRCLRIRVYCARSRYGLKVSCRWVTVHYLPKVRAVRTYGSFRLKVLDKSLMRRALADWGSWLGFSILEPKQYVREYDGKHSIT